MITCLELTTCTSRRKNCGAPESTKPSLSSGGIKSGLMPMKSRPDAGGGYGNCTVAAFARTSFVYRAKRVRRENWFRVQGSLLPRLGGSVRRADSAVQEEQIEDNLLGRIGQLGKFSSQYAIDV